MMLPIFDDSDSFSSWSHPWETVYINGHWVRTKSGGIDGYSSHIAMVPELKLGMAVLTSLSGIQASTMTIPNLYGLIDAFAGVLAANQKAPALPNNTEQFVGVYISNDSATFEVVPPLKSLFWFFILCFRSVFMQLCNR